MPGFGSMGDKSTTNPMIEVIRSHNRVMRYTVAFGLFTSFIVIKDYMNEKRNEKKNSIPEGLYLRDYR